jgi:ankyrin repeat protein
MKFAVALLAVSITLLRAANAAPIHLAIQKNDEGTVRELLSSNSTLVRDLDETGRTPLHIAAALGLDRIAKLLLDKGADINALTPQRATPLHLSFTSDANPVAALLIERNANLALIRPDGLSSLHYAAIRHFNNLIKLLQQHGVPTDVYTAAARGDTKLLASLLQTDSSLATSALPTNGYSALHFAAYATNSAATELLLRHRASPDSRDSNGLTALHWAAETDHTNNIVVLLAARPGLLESRTKEKQTPLHHAALTGTGPAAELLLARSADPNAHSATGLTPLHIAATRNATNVVARLLARSADVNARDAHGNTPLHLAAAYGAVGTVQLLLARKAQPSLKNLEGKTPLDIATAATAPLIVTQLGPDADTVVLRWALEHDNIAILTSLLQRKPVLVRQQDVQQSTPLHTAAARGNRPIVELLLARGADINARGKNGVTPLRAAITAKQPAIVAFLRERGARD